MIMRVIRTATLLASLTLVSVSGASEATQAATTCSPTGFARDAINLTAAIINPAGTVRGDVNATGCNIGIYYGPGTTGSVDHANVYGANYYGVVNNGGTVTVTQSMIHDIGERPLNGDQHGVGIYFAFGNVESGTISHDTLYNYQKGGIVVNGPGTSATVDHNVVEGQGPVSYIAQNGIQFGYGSTGTASQNQVSGNSYTGPSLAASGGIIVVGGDCYGGATTDNVTVDHNQLTGNDIGVWFSNLDSSCSNPVNTPTGDVASHNIITNNAVNNTTGNGPGAGYQAGIADQGDLDVLDHNVISGVGYTPVANPPPYLFCIDDSATNNLVESHNNCSK
ncbi:MAG TPA: hypothetical protein VFB34_07710 [Chloroflexota bacterium]|nr:hypothetical protein [Chloroflexota bacterium]